MDNVAFCWILPGTRELAGKIAIALIVDDLGLSSAVDLEMAYSIFMQSFDSGRDGDGEQLKRGSVLVRGRRCD